MSASKEKNRSLTTRKHKMNGFTLFETQRGWEVSWRATNGKYPRCKLPSRNLEEAITDARMAMLNHKGQGHRFNPNQGVSPRHHERFHIEDVLVDSGKHRNWTADTFKHDLDYCRYFLQWASPQGYLYWDEMRLEVVEAYLRYREEQNRAIQTIKHYLKPLRRASRWMAAQYPRQFNDICQGLRKPKSPRAKSYNDVPRNPSLTIHEVLDFLDWLDRHSIWSKLASGVALQGLTGLSLQEALRLKWSDVDFGEGIVTIQGEVKNEFRVRKIPVARVVLWLLKKRVNKATPVESYSHYSHYSAAIRKALRARGGLRFKPKNLRNTVQSFAMEAGFHGYYLKRYVGYAPDDTSGRHYVSEPTVEIHRQKVLTHLEAEIDSWAAPDGTAILPGPRLMKRVS